tara:strand:+ start:553 stop:1104 length:552 start_codon:yes stop_codon:yes gene_type:complete
MVDLSQAKQIEGHEDYWVFPDGRVYSNKLWRGKRGRFLNPPLRTCGKKKYRTVSLCGKKGRVLKSLHVLVAEAFIGPRPTINGKRTEVDHIDGNSLNNHVDNLRYGTRANNQINRPPEENCLSKYKGVSLNVRGRPFAQLSINNKTKYLGEFNTEIEAAKAYDKKAYEVHGEFAYLNFPEDYR